MVDIKKTGVSSSQKTVIKSGSTFGIKILQAVKNMTFPMLDRLLYITKSCQVLRRNYKEENVLFGSNISISIRPGFLVFKIHSYIWLHTTFSLTKLLTRSFDSICGGVTRNLTYQILKASTLFMFSGTYQSLYQTEDRQAGTAERLVTSLQLQAKKNIHRLLHHQNCCGIMVMRKIQIVEFQFHLDGQFDGSLRGHMQ